MGIIKAFTGAVSGSFANQWKDIFTTGIFDEQTVVSPGILKQEGSSNTNAIPGVISSGSKILIPENTAAFIFCQGGIEDIITEPGGYEYQNGQESIFNEKNKTKGFFSKLKTGVIDQSKDRFGYGGQTPDQKQIAFVNLREMREIKFGTKGPIIYNNLFYGTDLEITAFGSFSVKVTDAEKFIKDFVPPNVNYYSFNNEEVKIQIISDFLQSFTNAVNTLSSKYRISQVPSKANELAKTISDGSGNAGTWGEAFDDVSQKTSNIAAQQKIAKGIENKGLGDGGGMLFGMSLAGAMNPMNAEQSGGNASGSTKMTLDQQIEAVKKLKEMMDSGILSETEFEIKKKEIMGL